METKIDILKRSLPKWSALIVTGEPVTKKQAQEIIIRTSNLSLSTNDRDFEREAYQEFGVPMTYDGYSHPDYDAVSRVAKELHLLNLEYLDNNQICSNWISGPHGWISWAGNIGCNSYNIGKWPSIDEVMKDWKEIAKAFPYLSLKCQLFNKEIGEDEASPIVEFHVKNGEVAVLEPQSPINNPEELNMKHTAFRLFSSGGERGCTIPQLREAIQTTKEAVKDLKDESNEQEG
jgi:hypothetical protein